MGEIIPMKSKATTVQDIVNEMVAKHKNYFADKIEAGEMQPDEAFRHTDKMYRKAITNLKTAFPKKVQKQHYELFAASTQIFMQQFITKDAKYRVLPFLKSVALGISLITLIALLWML